MIKVTSISEATLTETALTPFYYNLVCKRNTEDDLKQKYSIYRCLVDPSICLDLHPKQTFLL